MLPFEGGLRDGNVVNMYVGDALLGSGAPLAASRGGRREMEARSGSKL